MALQDCGRYLVDAPYPEVGKLAHNFEYAALVSDAFAGAGSEATALSQYVAHNFYTLEHPELHFAYECIASVEFLHLKLLGGLVLKLGQAPKFMSYVSNEYWSGEFPVYAYQIHPILLADLEGEKAAIAHYLRLIRQINCPEMQALFRRIILDERKHVETINEFLRVFS